MSTHVTFMECRERERETVVDFLQPMNATVLAESSCIFLRLSIFQGSLRHETGRVYSFLPYLANFSICVMFFKCGSDGPGDLFAVCW